MTISIILFMAGQFFISERSSLYGCRDTGGVPSGRVIAT